MKKNKNNPKTLGKYVVTTSGNYMICKDGYFFFMTPTGKHLKGYEEKNKKLHCSQKWAELRSKTQVFELDEALSSKADWVITRSIIPMLKAWEKQKKNKPLKVPKSATIQIKDFRDIKQVI